MVNRILLFASVGLVLAACSSEHESDAEDAMDSGGKADSAPTQTPASSDAAPAEAEAVEPGLHPVSDTMVFRTPEFTLAEGEERYLCWATRVAESFDIGSYEYHGRPMVHHALFYGVAAADEPEEFTECDQVTFKAAWQPMFGSGAGQTGLEFPEGVARSVQEGSQVLVQLHLLNTTSKPVTDSTTLVMHRSSDVDAAPVNMGVIGNFDVSLPPGQTSQVIAECDVPSEVRLIGLWPHMHYLGTSLSLEVGPSADNMSPFYQRDPYAFDQQTIDSMDMVIPGGSHARVTCNYLNPGPNTVTYGESTKNEMCFLLTFTAGDGMTPCLSGKIPAVVTDIMNP